jgi:hypothetical protein
MAKTAKKTVKTPAAAEWKPFTTAEYREVVSRSVHFSAKGVNSNAEAFGIRLSGDAALPLPYVSVRCLMARGVPFATDYTKNTGSIATVFKQIRALTSGEAEIDPEEARAHLAAIAEAEAIPHREGANAVNPRLRQILLPKGGGYVAVTPLPSGGLSREINRRVAAHHERITEARKDVSADTPTPEYLRLGTLGVGGANPQNVGSLVREMQTALCFTAPAEDPELRIVYSIHYRGLRLGLPRRLMMAWRDWRDVAKARNQGRLPTDMASREAERDLLLAVGRAILNQGERARQRLEAQRERLPGRRLLSPELADGMLRGLIDPAERERDWPRQFGERVARTIGAYVFPDRGGVEPLDQDSLDHIARFMEELAR